MKLDVKLIGLNDLDLNTLELPKEEFVCYVICNNTVSNKDLLLKLIQGEVKEINVCGKYAGIWEKEANDVCVEYENNNKKSPDWYVSTGEHELDAFIKFIAFAHCEYYDDEVLSHAPILLFYDDENLKDYVLKRVEWLLEDTSTRDHHENDEDYDYDKEFMLKKRVELNFHTNKTNYDNIMSPDKAVWYANRSNLSGIAICDYYSTQGYIEAKKELSRGKKNLRVLYGVNINGAFVNNLNVIARNKKGKKAIYEYLTHHFTKGDKEIILEKDGVEWQTTELQKIIDDNRENLLIGLAYNSDAIDEALNNTRSVDINLIREDIADCDYIEIAPINRYKQLYPDKTEEKIKNAIKLIIDSAKNENKLVVATCAPQYRNHVEYLEYSLLYEHNNHKKLLDDFDAHIYTTEEMKYALDWLNDDAFVEEIVVTNTYKIMDMCEDFELVDKTYHAPYDTADGNLLALIVRTSLRLHSIYGESVDPLIKARYDDELKKIKENKIASIYMLAAGISDEAKFEGYTTGTRGSIGATLIGYLLGITKCNPLPPHYVCPKCHKVVWNATVEDGFDAKPKTCSECGTLMKSDGHKIPYETFMGLCGEKKPDIDLNLAPEFREKIVDVIKKVAPNNKAYRAGAINCISHNEAMQIVNEFAGEDDAIFDEKTKLDIADTLQNVTTGLGVHPGGYFIVPNDVDINDYTPLAKVGDEICTQNDVYDLTNYFYKADLLSHVDPKSFKFFKDNGLDLDEINILDSKVIDMFSPNSDLDYIGVPEFGYGSKMAELIETTNPKSFSDLVKVTSLAHGTNVWNNNGEILYAQGVELKDLLGCREDVYNALIKYGVDRINAYNIMENVRKGKGLTKEQEDIIKFHNLPKWFIYSCNKIRYMFPKAHAIEYVINALMIAWVKVYKPALFYAQYFNFRTDSYEIDTMCKSYEQIDERINELVIDENNENLIKTLEVVKDMALNGIKLVNTNVIKSDSKIEFKINPKNESEIVVSLSNI